MGYSSWSVVFGEQPSAAKWNILGTNDSSFNDGTGIANLEIGSGHTSVKNDYKFSVYRNAAQNTTGDAWTKTAFDTKTFDTGTNFDVVTNNRFTAPVTGFYWFDSTVRFSVAASKIMDIALYKNGSAIRNGGAGFSTTAGVTYYGLRVGGIFSLTAADYIEIFTFAATTTEALTVGSANSYFDGALMWQT